MKNKRFQDCNRVVKLWRYRWYLAIPFMVSWYRIFGMKILIDDPDLDVIRENLDVPIFYSEKDKQRLTNICKGLVQGKMEWWYTDKEVFANMKKIINDKNFKKF